MAPRRHPAPTCSRGHAMTAENTYLVPRADGWDHPECRACRADRGRKRKKAGPRPERALSTRAEALERARRLSDEDVRRLLEGLSE
jgi:hypothetical protein